jgi:putative ABC transport system permease protein
MKKNLIKKVGRAKVASMRKYGTSNSPLYSKNSNFAKFNNKMSKDPAVMQFLKDALPIVKARLAAGQDEYNEGLKSYKEAPAKLADGRKALAEGEATLAEGYAQYEDGKKQLEDGKAQLAVYEDGEQQVRDGLATLVGTEPMGSVQGIAD